MRELDQAIADLIKALPVFAEHGRVAEAWIEEIQTHGLALFGQAIPADDPGGARTGRERAKLVLFVAHLCRALNDALKNHQQTVEDLADGK